MRGSVGGGSTGWALAGGVKEEAGGGIGKDLAWTWIVDSSKAVNSPSEQSFLCMNVYPLFADFIYYLTK